VTTRPNHLRVVKPDDPNEQALFVINNIGNLAQEIVDSMAQYETEQLPESVPPARFNPFILLWCIVISFGFSFMLVLAILIK
jgi:hypothetical protein